MEIECKQFANRQLLVLCFVAYEKIYVKYGF